MLRFISLIKLVLSEAKKISGDTLQPALVIRLLGSCSWVVWAGPPCEGSGAGLPAHTGDQIWWWHGTLLGQAGFDLRSLI